jgi:Holliday junction resolvase RusA-like endonuclease
MIAFTIPGDPVGKGRPRATTIGGHARMYTPAKTSAYEELVAVYASAAMKKSPLLDHPVRLHLSIYCKVPGTWSKKRRGDALAGIERPAKKPDIDNIIKAVADGMNGVVWVDDSQIVELACSKHYALEPCVSVNVTSAEMVDGTAI